jgi:hypothetical protein
MTRRCSPGGRSGTGPELWARRWTGRPPCGGQGVRASDGGVRADRAPLAGAGVTRHGLGNAVCARTADADLVGAADRGLTFDKTDEKDAVPIARLTAQLRCYVPQPVDETWGRLRHLGSRRERLVAETVSQVQQMRDLLDARTSRRWSVARATWPTPPTWRGQPLLPAGAGRRATLVAVTSRARGGTSSAPDWQVEHRGDGHVGPGGY